MNAEIRPDLRLPKQTASFEAASAWVAWCAHHPDDAAARERCAAWRAESIEHEAAYQRADRSWRALGEVSDHPVIAAWRESARTTRIERRSWLLAAGVAAMAILVGGTLWFNGRPALPSIQTNGLRTQVQPGIVPAPAGEYRTAATRLGERQLMVLEDGTRVTLNTSSRLEINYRGPLRRINLVAGEAMFRVAKNPARAFVVTAGGKEVVALGTAFGVRVQGAAVKVTLLEGKVAVAPVHAKLEQITQVPGAVVLSPGEELREDGAAPPTVQRVDAEHALSWQDGWLVFDKEPLTRALAEISRYTAERIEYEDPRMATLLVSGTLRTGQVDDLVDALVRVYPLKVEHPSPGVIHLAWKK